MCLVVSTRRNFSFSATASAAALKDPRVLDAIMSGANRNGSPICFVEWSGAQPQKVIIDWTLIDSADAARNNSPMRWWKRRAVPFADRASIQRRDRLLGTNNCTRALSNRSAAPSTSRATARNSRPRVARGPRENALALGVTINGLVILGDRRSPQDPEHTNPPGGLAKYFQDNVIGGSAHSLLVAENFPSFGQALISKLIAEMRWRPDRG